jgi:hypothetical protein
LFRISLDYPKAGWASVHLNDGGQEFVVSGSNATGDVLRDFVDAVQSLQTADAAECCWFQEPGELHWSFRNTGQQLEIEIVNFPDLEAPGRHVGQATIVFKSHTSWYDFGRQVLASFESIETPEYEPGWRFPFPKEACEKLRNALENQH